MHSTLFFFFRKSILMSIWRHSYFRKGRNHSQQLPDKAERIESKRLGECSSLLSNKQKIVSRTQVSAKIFLFIDIWLYCFYVTLVFSLMLEPIKYFYEIVWNE